MQSADIAISKPAPCEQHDCNDFTVLTADGEVVCIRCGRVMDEEAERLSYENGVSNGKAYTASDHNAGNGLFNSVGEQSGYVSKQSPGTMMRLQARGAKLNNAYKSGLVADPSKGCHVEVDPLTGKIDVKFSRYDVPTLQLVKEKTLQRCVEYHLDTVQQTLIAKELTRVYSNLVMTDICRYLEIVSMLNYRHFLPKSAIAELEEELAGCVSRIRDKVVSGCAPKPKK